MVTVGPPQDPQSLQLRDDTVALSDPTTAVVPLAVAVNENGVV